MLCNRWLVYFFPTAPKTTKGGDGGAEKKKNKKSAEGSRWSQARNCRSLSIPFSRFSVRVRIQFGCDEKKWHARLKVDKRE